MADIEWQKHLMKWTNDWNGCSHDNARFMHYFWMKYDNCDRIELPLLSKRLRITHWCYLKQLSLVFISFLVKEPLNERSNSAEKKPIVKAAKLKMVWQFGNRRQCLSYADIPMAPNAEHHLNLTHRVTLAPNDTVANKITNSVS